MARPLPDIQFVWRGFQADVRSHYLCSYRLSVQIATCTAVLFFL